MKVAVLGGGPAGLYAAWILARRGVDVTVVEKEGEPGGLCRTADWNGYRFDLGGHRFLTESPGIFEDVSSLLGEDLLPRTRVSLIDRRGTTLRYPPSFAEIARRLPPSFVLRSLLSYLLAQAGNRSAASTLEGWLVARYGKVLYREIFQGYSEKLWGVPPSALSADWAPERISAPGLGRMAAALLAGGKRVRSFAERYWYPRLGIGQIFDRMAGAIAGCGGRILAGRRVERLERSGGRVTAVLCSGGSGTEAVEADRVITTIPPGDFARAAGIPVPALSFRGLLFLDLVVDAERVGDATWIYLPDPDIPATRLQRPSSRSEAMVPPGGASLMLEIPFTPGDPVDASDRETLSARCVRELARRGWVAEDGVRERYFRREEFAYPVYRLGYDAVRAAYLRGVMAQGNVLPAGRQGLFRYLFMDRAMESGRHAALALLGEADWAPWEGGNFAGPPGTVR